MTDVLPRADISAVRKLSAEEQAARLKSRYRADRRFKFYGLGAIGLALAMLLLLLGSIVLQGYSAFWQTHIKLPIEFSAELIAPDGKRDRDALAEGDYQGLVRAALQAKFPDVSGRQELRALTGLLSQGGADRLREMVLDDPSLIGAKREVWLPASDDIDMLHKGSISASSGQDERRVKDNELGWFDALTKEGRVESQFNTRFLTGGDSREPELAGVWGAIVGSFLTLIITMLLAFPIGVAAAIYLEEFAPKNRWTDLIEVNINNLAAVPSIVFGLLGLAMFLGTFGLPRSTPVVGGLTLALMTLPIIIIASRAALKAVPPSIREAARGLGASPMQVVFHHVLPLAMPGVLTGSILGMAHALGETAPLLMIGMVAFIVDIPGGPLSSATVLPVQIFIWADSPERAFVEKTSAAIMVLLAFLILMNLAAVWLRRRFERRW
ncbi:MAG: pstA [Alphaproteobacteria bacterium]|nr:pstA [Alphaproteobacteria bacterium]